MSKPSAAASLDLVPTVTEVGQAAHHAERRLNAATQRYQTGPRAGQELAHARKIRREAAALRPEGRR